VAQLADQLGTYGISALVVLGNVLAFRILGWLRLPVMKSLFPTGPSTRAWVLPAACLLAALVYGQYRLATDPASGEGSPILLRVGLIQDNTPTIFEINQERALSAWKSYVDNTALAYRRFSDLDLVVWPESTFDRLGPYIEVDRVDRLPPDVVDQERTLEEFQEYSTKSKSYLQIKAHVVLAAARGHPYTIDDETGALASDHLAMMAPNEKPHLIVGADHARLTKRSFDRYNAAFHIDPRGELLKIYHKQHLVVFGEYFPLGDLFPWLNRLVGLAQVRSGTTHEIFEVRGVRLAPSICFENMVPHLMQRQVKQLSQTAPVQVMINLTNDGWFHGSSMLDHHLNCAILASIENRRPMLIAGNSSQSAWIDGCGRVRGLSHRMRTDAILAEPRADQRWGLWQSAGDWPTRLAGIPCGWVWMGAIWQRWRKRSAISNG
jgi:apolipoprotein N-acyltransferase